MIFFKPLNNTFNLSQNKSTPYLSKPQNNSGLEFKNVVQDSKNFVLHDKIPVTYKGGRAFLETNIEQIPDKNTKENWLNMVLDGADNCVKNMVDKNKS